ncbi:Rrf2 family transcriptional regulator [Brachyspira hyodysenteriae]|uniref:Rrf2 family transcriptional regulator n=3 Tax=Brachyspira hyodysenteriae TaxID=159 RepID=A0A3B6VPZ9_BRAHO|nr:Rrf2 family transcriptional regulator [Brachyspira hyodysenteriae]ANN62717.1 Rrf2 family transcriptional regulator [Brachyspira hyodysenteriae ATCC 27164]AUJ50975.1 Rrf2 family transcriptional regulator [Brachyspira hyodysenteriae]KLI13297.1 Rrf2 family transcriptional regulator [Brachyspira hyodysenteriae]KLI14123.1 Rrf2 family transcriptional regulator [Brachyspira hyodysenteriae]KLI15754.1 Rrf2 family transcriptional regulator [Brachyspira hyodysenteriae]
MKISSRFTIAIHTLLCILKFKDEKMTSSLISDSVNVNPVIIRNILIQLQKADIITVKRGTGGISLNRKIENINLLDIFNAVESLDNNKLFSFHENPNKKCPVGSRINDILQPKLDDVQNAMEKELKKTTLKDIYEKLKN